MKKLTVLLAGLGIATAAIPGIASAAPFGPPINQRQNAIEQRIDQGLRSGALDRNEAFRLRSQLRDIAQLQYRYARSGGGIDRREAADLQHRYDVLSSKVKVEKHDRDYGRGPGPQRGPDRDHRW